MEEDYLNSIAVDQERLRVSVHLCLKVTIVFSKIGKLS